MKISRFDYREDSKGKDADIYSPQLRNDLEKLYYHKKLPNGEFFDITQGKYCADDYLIWKDMRFASDSITNVYLHHEKYNVINEVKNTDFYDNLIKKYNDNDYHIGCHILFPKNNNPNKSRSWTINQARGTNAKICDRFDLTLECIRRFYIDKKLENPLIEKLEEYSYFFDLFINFKGYVEFFHLQDLIDGNDYNKIKFYLPFDDFKRYAKPQNVQEWEIFCKKQIEFAQLRNERIYKLEL